MSKLQIIEVKESIVTINGLLKKSSHAVVPRLQMLLAIANGMQSTNELALKAKVNRDSIRNWKNIYQEQGINGLLEDNRGGNRKAAINSKQKEQLRQKLANPKGGFTSYKQAMDWINQTFALEMEYQAVNKYLKRHFGTKLKVGRKTHINKEENAEALFKKTIRGAKTH